MISILPSRGYYLIAKYGPIICGLLLIMGSIGIGTATVMYTHPPTTEVTTQTNQKTVQSSLSTHALVTGNSSVYEQGSLLKNEPIYLLDTTPNLRLILTTTFPPSGEHTIDHQIELVYTASRNKEIFWKRVKILSTKTNRTDERIVTQTDIWIPSIIDQRKAYQSEFGDAATVSVTLRFHINYSVGKYQGSFTKSIPIQTGTSWYAVSPATMSRTHSTQVTETV
ncbi:MAG: hypothetical protein ABEI06_09890, partial [Halobacteriaceae archaeon]